MWKRLKRLWELSKPPTQGFHTWNGVPVSKEVFEANMAHPPPHPAINYATGKPIFIPRITRTPIEEINQEPQ